MRCIIHIADRESTPPLHQFTLGGLGLKRARSYSDGAARTAWQTYLAMILA